MIHFSRLGTLTFIAGGILSAAPFVYAAGADLRPVGPAELLLTNSAQGYLGVGLNDVDNDRAAALKLKEARGAEIVRIDQDAPAAKAGLKVHDVVVQMNGQQVDSVEQLRRMLRETPPGRTVSLVATRDGRQVSITVQLADRAAIAKQIIIGLGDDDLPPSLSADDAGNQQVLVMPRGGRSGSLLGPMFGHNRYYVGVEVQPLTSGLAEYFGVKSGAGLLIGNVFPNSPGAAAGLKAADVIQKVNGQPIVSLSDWERAIRLNHGKQVQVTVIRDKKEQTVSMVAGQAKSSSELQLPEVEPFDPQMIAELRGGILGIDVSTIDQQVKRAMDGIDAEALRRQAEQAVRSVDMQQQVQKALEESRQQMLENRQQIEQQMQNLRQTLQSLRLEQMD